MIEHPGWFVVFTWCELLFHLPVCLWTLKGLYNGMFGRPAICLKIYEVQCLPY